MSLIVSKTKPLTITKLARIPLCIDWGGMAAKREKDGNTAHTWNGVQHAKLVTALQKEIELQVPFRHGETQIQAWTAHNGGSVAACFQVKDRKWCGVTTSNISLGRLKVYCGMVAEDGTRIISEVLTGSLYNQNFDLTAECQSLVTGWRDGIAQTEVDKINFQNCQLSPNESSTLILEAGRRIALPWKYLGRLDAAYYKQPKTAWGLMSAFSHVVSTCPPLTQMSRLFLFRTMVVDILNLKSGVK